MDLITHGNQSMKPQKNNIFSKFLKVVGKQKSVTNIDSFDSESYKIIESIKNAKSEWENANLNFEYAEDEELIDYYTYKIKASEVRYEYYLKKAKEKGLRVEAAVPLDSGYNMRISS